VFNHTFYWNSMKTTDAGRQGKLPRRSSKPSTIALNISRPFQAVASQFGSSWAWLLNDSVKAYPEHLANCEFAEKNLC
jgi:superoxide dismutase